MSGVIYANAPITIIAKAQDHLANNMAKPLGTWEAEVKLYRANTASLEGTPLQGEVLYTTWLSDAKPEHHVIVHSSKESVVAEASMSDILEYKLQSIWQLRQTFKAEGQLYDWEGGRLRVANVFVQGNYKGLLIDITTPEDATESFIENYQKSLRQAFLDWGLQPDILDQQLQLKPGQSLIEKSRLYQKLSS